MIPNPNAETEKSRKPPKRYWQATEPFVDLKLSHLVQIVLTAALIGVAGTQAWVYFRQANIMRGQLYQMQADQRPWISPSISLSGPLVFTGDHDAVIYFIMVIRNIGRAPALNVSNRIEVHVVEEHNIFDSIEGQKQICGLARAKADMKDFRGQTLFPDDEKRLPSSATISHTDFAKAWPDTNNVFFRIIGCIDYTFAADRKSHGQTGFSYDLMRPADGGAHRSGFDPRRGNVPADNLALEPDFFTGGYIK